jgi:hypothetical protein
MIDGKARATKLGHRAFGIGYDSSRSREDAMSEVQTTAGQVGAPGVRLAPPTRRSIQRISGWDAVLHASLNGLAYPLGSGSSLAPNRFVQPSRRELPVTPSKSAIVEQGAEEVASDSTTGSTQ